jgi:hypothetical protein
MKGLSTKDRIDFLRRERIRAFQNTANGAVDFSGTIRYKGGAIIPFGATADGILADVTPSRDGKELGPKDTIKLKL